MAKLAKYDKAIDDYAQVIVKEQNNIHALHNRGISYERLGRHKEAIGDFTRVIKIDPSNANAYFNRGCCYDSIGELDLAISDYSIALELDLRSGNEDADADEEQQSDYNVKESERDDTQRQALAEKQIKPQGNGLFKSQFLSQKPPRPQQQVE